MVYECLSKIVDLYVGDSFFWQRPWKRNFCVHLQANSSNSSTMQILQQVNMSTFLKDLPLQNQIDPRLVRGTLVSALSHRHHRRPDSNLLVIKINLLKTVCPYINLQRCFHNHTTQRYTSKLLGTCAKSPSYNAHLLFIAGKSNQRSS